MEAGPGDAGGSDDMDELHATRKRAKTYHPEDAGSALADALAARAERVGQMRIMEPEPEEEHSDDMDEPHHSDAPPRKRTKFYHQGDDPKDAALRHARLLQAERDYQMKFLRRGEEIYRELAELHERRRDANACILHGLPHTMMVRIKSPRHPLVTDLAFTETMAEYEHTTGEPLEFNKEPDPPYGLNGSWSLNAEPDEWTALQWSRRPLIPGLQKWYKYNELNNRYRGVYRDRLASLDTAIAALSAERDDLMTEARNARVLQYLGVGRAGVPWVGDPGGVREGEAGAGAAMKASGKKKSKRRKRSSRNLKSENLKKRKSKSKIRRRR